MQIKDDELVWRCSMHGKINKGYKNLVEKVKGRNYLGDIGVHVRIILKWILGTGVTWIRTASSDRLF
jgi:hypothetical protein